MEKVSPFEVKVGVHQRSLLSPLLFIIVLEALSRRFREGLPYELLYADDLVLMTDSMEELMEKLEKWKESLETKGLRVNLSKTKVMHCSDRDRQPRQGVSTHVEYVRKELGVIQ